MSGNFGLEGGLGLLGGRVRGVSLSNQELELPSFNASRSCMCSSPPKPCEGALCTAQRRPSQSHLAAYGFYVLFQTIQPQDYVGSYQDIILEPVVSYLFMPTVDKLLGCPRVGGFSPNIAPCVAL